MSNDSKAGLGVATGLALGLLSILGGPVAVIAGIGIFSGSYGIAKAFKNRERNDTSDNHYNSSDSLSKFVKKYSDVSYHKHYIPPISNINTPSVTTPSQTRHIVPEYDPNRYDVYDVPPPRATARTHHNEFTEPARTYHRETHQTHNHTEQNNKRFRTNEYGEIFEE